MGICNGSVFFVLVGGFNGVGYDSKFMVVIVVCSCFLW